MRLCCEAGIIAGIPACAIACMRYSAAPFLARPVSLGAGTAMAIIPGRITRNGNTILGSAAMSGVRRAAFIESAAIARWTTRKSVHQYPNDSTNPRPITSPNHSTPMGFAAGLPMWRHDSVIAPGSKPRDTASCARRADRPDQPPTSFIPMITSGTNPATMRKNWRTSL